MDGQLGFAYSWWYRGISLPESLGTMSNIVMLKTQFDNEINAIVTKLPLKQFC